MLIKLSSNLNSVTGPEMCTFFSGHIADVVKFCGAVLKAFVPLSKRLHLCLCYSTLSVFCNFTVSDTQATKCAVHKKVTSSGGQENSF